MSAAFIKTICPRLKVIFSFQSNFNSFFPILPFNQ